MEERGVNVDHATLNRWVIRYAPAIAAKAHSQKRNTSGESLFLRKLVLGIPAQASGKNLTRLVNAFGAPIRLRHLVPTQQGGGT